MVVGIVHLCSDTLVIFCIDLKVLIALDVLNVQAAFHRPRCLCYLNTAAALNIVAASAGSRTTKRWMYIRIRN